MGVPHKEKPMSQLLTERHAAKIRGTLSCLDRVVIMGTLPQFCYADGMTSYLYQHQIRIFDYPKWAEPLRDEIRSHAEQVAAEAGVQIEFVRRADERKEDRIAKVLAKRGDHPGLVHVLSAMESCGTYKPWHDKESHRTFLKPDTGKCLHYYFYFIDAELGLCYLRVPTWAPFRLQFYFNGHNRLAALLKRRGVEFSMLDNAFVQLDDTQSAEALALPDVRVLHKTLDRVAATYCPFLKRLEQRYHWSMMQVEYSTDIIFHRQQDLDPLYDEITRTCVHAVKAPNVATFLGRKLTNGYTDEMGNDFHTRVEGTCIKHHMGPITIKMYNKHGIVLRIEIVVNDVSFFMHYRWVEHRDGTGEMKLAKMKKTIYSLPDLIPLLAAANRRYIEFISDIDDPTPAIKTLDKLSRPARDDSRSYRGFNLFHGDDIDVFRVLLLGGFLATGFRNAQLRKHLTDFTTRQVSALLKRLRTHGIIKKAGKSYKYYVTGIGRRLVLAGIMIKDMFLIPKLRGQLAVS